MISKGIDNLIHLFASFSLELIPILSYYQFFAVFVKTGSDQQWLAVTEDMLDIGLNETRAFWKQFTSHHMINQS